MDVKKTSDAVLDEKPHLKRTFKPTWKLYRGWKEDKLMEEHKEYQKDKKIKLDIPEESKKEKVERKKKDKGIKHKIGKLQTVSIAVPGFIMQNAQTEALRTYLAGQIARAAAIFNVDEIIVYDEVGSQPIDDEGSGKNRNPNIVLARILQYLECPPYLRQTLFPQHRDLKFAGLLNPINLPHHVKKFDRCPYREGVVTKNMSGSGGVSLVNVGLTTDIPIDKILQQGIRVTVKMEDNNKRGSAVSPSQPMAMAGIHWGYSVRLAASLQKVFTESPYKKGYDCLIGTSDKGSSVDEFDMPKFKHALIVFGGVNGIEACLDADQELQVEDPSLLFHHYLNTCPNQGSATIRTEEALMISLAALRPKIAAMLDDVSS